MPPKIKSSKLLKNIYQGITSLIDDQPVVKAIIKEPSSSQIQEGETAVKSQLPDIIAKDPYFVPTTPYNREGYNGEEIVYGIRKATPWQVAMGQDINQRLIDLGYNIKDVMPISLDRKTIFYKPSQLIRKQARKPIDVVDVPNPENNYTGYRAHDGQTVLITRPIKYKDKIFDTQLHESLMHGTDDIIESLQYHNQYAPSIIGAYDAISSKIPIDPKHPAHHWEELRATLGEIRADMYKTISYSKGEDFNRKPKITSKLRKEFIKMVDDMQLEDLETILAGTNGYGQKYAELLRRSKARSFGKLKSGDFVLDQLKMLLKYYPAVGLGTSAIYNPEPDNYVEERKYKVGGQIQNINKFTIYKYGGNIKKRCRKKSNC